MVLVGLLNKESTLRLAISERTVESHCGCGMPKLHAASARVRTCISAASQPPTSYHTRVRWPCDAAFGIEDTRYAQMHARGHDDGCGPDYEAYFTQEEVVSP